jgi:hypothetical protein
VSISLFPGAVNADLSGYAGSFWQRAKGLLGTCICFILSGGDLEALTEDMRHEQLPNARAIRSEAQSSVQGRVRQNSGISEDDELDSDEPAGPSKGYHRAITSLYAGTDPEASRLNGKVRVLGLSRIAPDIPTYRTRKTPFQYLTAWARVTLPSKRALDSELGTKLWNWCEEQVTKDTKVDEDVKVREDTEVDEDTKPKVEEDIKVEEVNKVVEVTKAEEDTKPKEDIKVDEGPKVDEADEATKAKEDTEAKEDTKSKE